MKIVNLTQHNPTSDQDRDGVVMPSETRAVDIHPDIDIRVKALLNFEGIEDAISTILCRAQELSLIAKASDCSAAMIGGAPYLMPPLVKALRKQGIKPLFSFTERVSVENHGADGTVTKTNVFKHVGFVSCGDEDEDEDEE